MSQVIADSEARVINSSDDVETRASRNPPTGPALRPQLATGDATLAGLNPTVVPTGLREVRGAVVSLKGASAPGDDPVLVTVEYDGQTGALHVYAWKHNGSDPTLVASTNNTAVVSWLAFGV